MQQLALDLSITRQELSSARTEIAGNRQSSEEKLALLTDARTELSHQFKTLANEILDEKSKRFDEQNNASMGTLLTPLREKLSEFQTRVEALREDGIAGRSELKVQIESLRNMNEKLSIGAENLVKALKGSSKTQGDWGEVLLIGILEAAGLRAGREYRVQASFATEEGNHVRPDIILDLPNQKHLVIDSKVSLSSYSEYCACEDEESRKVFLDRHTHSLRNHMDGLSKKAYQGLHQLQSLDFVIMFVPIEPAYLLALSADGNLWQRAWARDVLLVSPSTLYPVLRTIQYAWQQERQSRNVEEIVRQGSALYDKVAVFASSFEDVGRRLGAAQSSYDKAYGQLATGRGNVLAQIEKMRALGLRKTKSMPAGMSRNEADDATGTGLHDSDEPGPRGLPLLDPELSLSEHEIDPGFLPLLGAGEHPQ
jgi:DNA recombination protein RmuC